VIPVVLVVASSLLCNSASRLSSSLDFKREDDDDDDDVEDDDPDAKVDAPNPSSWKGSRLRLGCIPPPAPPEFRFRRNLLRLRIRAGPISASFSSAVRVNDRDVRSTRDLE